MFRNKKTGKEMKLNEISDRHLIRDLEKNPDWKELMYI
jgi:hypothetical protein